MRAIYEQQRPGPAVLAGTAGAIAAATLWALVLGYGEVRSSLVGLAVGVVTGIPVRIAGRGVEFRYGLLGGSLAVLAGFAGNFPGYVILKSRVLGIPYGDALSAMSGREWRLILTDSIDPLSLLFCLLAFGTAFGCSVRFVRPGQVAAAVWRSAPLLNSLPNDLSSIPGSPAPPGKRGSSPPQDLTPVVKKRLPMRHGPKAPPAP